MFHPYLKEVFISGLPNPVPCRTNEQMLVAPGLVCFPLPIMEHTESLVVRDKKGLYAGIMHNL